MVTECQWTERVGVVTECQWRGGGGGGRERKKHTHRETRLQVSLTCVQDGGDWNIDLKGSTVSVVPTIKCCAFCYLITPPAPPPRHCPSPSLFPPPPPPPIMPFPLFFSNLVSLIYITAVNKNLTDMNATGSGCDLCRGRNLNCWVEFVRVCVLCVCVCCVSECVCVWVCVCECVCECVCVCVCVLPL